jgi:hypothetical protein
MNRIVIAATAATIAFVPAAIGFAGSSFAQGLTGQSTSVTDDKGGQTRHAEPGDDRGTDVTATPSASATTDDKGGLTKHVEPGDDNGGATEVGDDKGGATKHAEPGDDNGGQRTSATRSSDDGTHHSSSHSSSTSSSSHRSSHSTATPGATADDHGRGGHGKDDAPNHG